MGLPYRCDDSDCVGNGMSEPTLHEIQWNTWGCKTCGKNKHMTEAERLEFVVGYLDETVDKLSALQEKVDSLVSGNNGL